MKVRDVIVSIEADGWYLHSMKGDHRQFKHPAKKGRVTGKLGSDLAPGTLASIWKQAKLSREER